MAITGVLSVLTGSGRATFSTIVAGNKITIDGHDFECVNSGASGDEFNKGSDDTEAAANCADAINASTTSGIEGLYVASSDGPVVTVESLAGPLVWTKTGSPIEIAWNVLGSVPFTVLATFTKSDAGDVAIEAASSNVSSTVPHYENVGALVGVPVPGSGSGAGTYPVTVYVSELEDKVTISCGVSFDGSTTITPSSAIVYVENIAGRQ